MTRPWRALPPGRQGEHELRVGVETTGSAEAPEAVDFRGDPRTASDRMLKGQHPSLPLRWLPGFALRNHGPRRIAPTLSKRREKSGRRLTETAGPRIYVCDAAVYFPPSRLKAPRIVLAPPRAEPSALAYPHGPHPLRIGSESRGERSLLLGRLLSGNSILRTVRREEMFVGNQAPSHD